MNEILTCPICGIKYNNVGAIPQICQNCWMKKFGGFKNENNNT